MRAVKRAYRQLFSLFSGLTAGNPALLGCLNDTAANLFDNSAVEYTGNDVHWTKLVVADN